MRQDCMDAMTKGEFIKRQVFDTPKGTYRLAYLKYENDIFMFKYHNTKLVEACNLSNMKGD